MKKMFWIVGSIAIVVILLVGWIGKGSVYQLLRTTPIVEHITNSSFKVIAHRGYSAVAPENTLSAFQKALDCRADMIELDVHFSKDHQVIVIHDATLQRTTGKNGTVKEATLAELKTLDAGSWFGKNFANEPVPTLEEVIQLVAGKSTLLIEIKVDEQNNTYDGLVTAILQLIEKYEAEEWCILQAFDSEYLREIQQAKTEIRYYKLIVNTHDPVPTYIDTRLRWGMLDKSIPYQAINPYYKSLTPSKIKEWQQEGYEVYTYTVNELDDMKLITEMGVNGIITNYPERAIKLREEIRGRGK